MSDNAAVDPNSAVPATAEPQPAGSALAATLFDRTLWRLRKAWRDAKGGTRLRSGSSFRPDLPEGDLRLLRQQVDECLHGLGGEVAARLRAAELGRAYLTLSDSGRQRFFRLLAEEYGASRDVIGPAVEAWRQAGDEETRRAAERQLRGALQGPRMTLLRQFNVLEQGVKFLVDMRADLLGLTHGDPAYRHLDADLREILVTWFDIGFLDLSRITWQAPAALLEKLIAYEAVHRIESWADLKKRLDSDRRCYAFFHPRMPDEPLIFVEVALVDGIAGDVQDLLDRDVPALDPREADTAIFYSISNCQKGLSGVSFGNFLIKRVVEELQRDLPNLKSFATLSPIPGFRAWLSQRLEADSEAALPEAERRLLRTIAPADLEEASDGAILEAILERPDWHLSTEIVEVLQPILTRLAAEYLLKARRGRKALDRVAHFHLSNGARVERLNWLGDRSEKGLREAAGMMVNYRYKLDEIDKNHEAYTTDGTVNAVAAVRRLLRG